MSNKTELLKRILPKVEARGIDGVQISRIAAILRVLLAEGGILNHFDLKLIPCLRQAVWVVASLPLLATSYY